MIVVDTSALFALLDQEPEPDAIAARIAHADRAIIGAPTAFKFRLVAHRKKGPLFREAAAKLINQKPFELYPWTPELVTIAADALERFGGRPARLNFGDCMAYALAKSLGAPLPYKGGDFADTDIARALG